MKQNNVKLNARLNAVGNAYAKATGMPIVGEMMMAAGNGTTETDTDSGSGSGNGDLPAPDPTTPVSKINP